MIKTKATKRALLSSALALLLCVSMLIGSTYAWFTDSVTSAGNIIKSGTLDVEFTWVDAKEATDATYADASAGPIFNYELWEPGYVAARRVKIANVGNLALHYQLRIAINGELEENSTGHTLADAIDVYYLDEAAVIPTREAFNAYVAANNVQPTSLKDVLAAINGTANTAEGNLYPAGTEGRDSVHEKTIVLKMREDAGNEYQNMSLGASFSVQLLATQLSYEEDSFGPDYDGSADGTPDNAVWPVASATVVAGRDTVISNDIATVTVPANAAGVEAGDKITLKVVPTDDDPGFTVETGSSITTYDVSLENQNGVKIAQTAGTDLYKVELDIGVVDLQDFYHNTTALTLATSLAEVDAENEYFYDVDTGIVTFITASFSPFTSEYKYSGGIGTEAYPYLVEDAKEYIAFLKTESYHYVADDYYYIWAPNDEFLYIKLIDDIDLDGFDIPDVQYEYLDFNGNHKTISNANGGLFGYSGKHSWEYGPDRFYDLTVKDSTSRFGIFGYGTLYDTIQFNNITIDGCECGDGAFYSYAYAGGEYTNKIEFTNCRVVNTTCTLRSTSSVAGYVGNIQYVKMDGCTFQGTIESNNQTAYGLVGQYSIKGDSYIRNCSVEPGTIIKNIKVTDGKVCAFNGSGNYNKDGNKFYGTLVCANYSGAVFNGFDTTQYQGLDVIDPASFEIGEGGSITYVGTEQFGKIFAAQFINTDHMIDGVYNAGGYPVKVQTTDEVSNVSKGTVITGLTKIRDIQNVDSTYASSIGHCISTLPEGLSFNDSEFLINDGVLYINCGGSIVLSGTANGGVPSVVNVTIILYVFDNNGNQVNTISYTYPVTLS